MAGYSYVPIYGAEPFDNVQNAPVTTIGAGDGIDALTTFGGGAKVTGDNLLVTLWANVEQNVNGQIVAGDLLQPVYAQKEGSVKDAFPGFLNKGYGQFAKSRTSFKLLIGQAFEQEEPPLLTLPLWGILNPPGELKNAYKYAVRAARTAINAVTNPAGALLTFKKSIIDGFMWNSSFYTSATLVQTSALAGDASFGSLLSFLCKNSGADGHLPEIYPSMFELWLSGDVDALNAYFDALERGDFYIPAIFSPSADPGEGFWIAEIAWPHSVPR